LKTATEVSPRAFSFHLLGRAYMALDRYADAEVIYERAADLASAVRPATARRNVWFEGVGDGYMKIDQKENAARAYRVLYNWIRKQRVETKAIKAAFALTKVSLDKRSCVMKRCPKCNRTSLMKTEFCTFDVVC